MEREGAGGRERVGWGRSEMITSSRGEGNARGSDSRGRRPEMKQP